jgi:hypothetical protein
VVTNFGENTPEDGYKTQRSARWWSALRRWSALVFMYLILKNPT